MKKKLLLVLMLIAAVVVMPRVHAADEITIVENANPDTFVNNNKTAGSKSEVGDVITFTYTTGDFKLLAGMTGSGGNTDRPADKAWVGFKINFPTSGITNYALTNAKTNAVVASGNSNPSDGVLNVYVGFNEDMLKNAVDNATNIEFSYTLTVTTDSGTITKKINVIIVPENISLKDTDGSTSKWDHNKYESEVASVMSKLYGELDATVSVAKGMDTSKYTAESVKTLEDAIAEAEAAGKDLTTNNQAAVIALRNAITNAIANLVVKGNEPVKPGSTTTDTNKPGEQAPDTFDAGLTYVGLALSAVGASVVSIKKLRNN